MNSLPFISHHLFVAAIGNEGRGHERPTRRERPFAGPADQASAIALEVMDARKPMPAGATRALRATDRPGPGLTPAARAAEATWSGVCMEARSLEFIATACAGEQLSGLPETRVRRVCTDSRQVQAGDLFFALPGERFDGHDFLREAAQKGAGAVVVERRRVPADWSGCAVIAVEDTRKALGRLAARYRKDFALPVVAVGGSNGKTTTKELMAAVLRQRARHALERGQLQQRHRRAADVAAAGEIASGGGAGSGHQPSGRTGAAGEDDSAELRRHHLHRPRASGILRRSGGRGPGRRLAGRAAAGGRKAVCERRR